MQPELTKQGDHNTFLEPMNTSAWLGFFAVVVVFLTSLHVLNIFSVTKISASLEVARVLGLQGKDALPSGQRLRFELFIGHALMTMIISVYSAALLNVILMPPEDKYGSAVDVVSDRKLAVARTNVVQISKHLKVTS